MTLIKTIKLSSLHQEEDFGFHQLIRDEFAKYSDPRFTDAFTAYNDSLQHFDEVIKPIRSSIHTPKLAELDQQRDNAYHGLAGQVKNILRYQTGDKAEAAKKVEVIMRNYGDPTALPYIEENGVMDNLLQDLELQETVTAIATIGAGDWVADMKTAHREFVALFAQRNNEQADLMTGESKEARLAVDAAYKTCVARLNAIAELGGDDICFEVIKNVNKEIDYQKSVLAARKTRHEKNRKEKSAIKN